MAIISGCFADTNLTESNFFWLEDDDDIENMPAEIHNGSLAVSIESGSKWVKNSSGVWTSFGG